MRDVEASGKPGAAQARRYASAQQGHTAQSLPTTFLPTPAPHADQRRIRDFTTTSHLEVSLGNQAFSKQVRSPLLSWLLYWPNSSRSNMSGQAP